MMRKLTVAVAIAVIASSAMGAIFVSWNGPSGFVRNDGSTPIVETGWSALAQLIFTADGTQGAALTDGSAVGNTVLATYVFNNTNTGSDYGDGFSAANYTSGVYSTGSGYLYVRVFDRGSDSGLTAGMWYHDSPSVFATLSNGGPPASPDDVNAGAYASGDGPFGTYILNSGQVIVPEPTTWALLGFGALAMFLRRRIAR